MLDAPLGSRSAVISALRHELAQRGLDAFILPREDAHQNEYVAPHDARLTYVTGFSGSSGIAIVTARTVAVFVDGRYQLQLRNECPGADFSHHHILLEPPDIWLKEHAQPRWKVGYDPIHLTPRWFDRFAAACIAAQTELLAQDANPVDAIWPDQPKPPSGHVKAFPVRHAGRCSADKLRDLITALDKRNADFLVDTQPDNIAWLLNVRGSDVAFNPAPHSFLLVGRNGRVRWFVNPQKLENEVLLSLPPDVELMPDSAFPEGLAKLIRKGQRLLVDPDFSPVAVRHIIQQLGAEAVPAPGLLGLAKAVKNPVELEGLRACHLADGIALTEFGAWLSQAVPSRAKTGNPVTELEAEEAMLTHRRAHPDFISESFRSISAASGNAAMCHYAASAFSNAPLLPHSTYLLDSGGQYVTGTTDATRSFSFGRRPKGYDQAYTAVFKAFCALATLRFPRGTQGHHIDAICRRPLWDLGLDYDHGTGHGVGHQLSVHEHPHRIGRRHNPVDLRPGMVLTIEPGFYQAGRFGIRIENVFEIVEEKDSFLTFRSLTLTPIQTDMLIVEELSDTERGWLNTYHAVVREAIETRLSPPARAWLGDVTPII